MNLDAMLVFEPTGEFGQGDVGFRLDPGDQYGCKWPDLAATGLPTAATRLG